MDRRKAKDTRNANAAYRIIDVNYNRLIEGLRVIEDIARFMYNDRRYTWNLRAIKNSISKIIYKHYPLLIAHRNVEVDFGKEWLESKRKNIEEIFFVNLARVKESLRVLEEFIKLFSSEEGKKIKTLRYRIYKLEKEFFEKRKDAT